MQHSEFLKSITYKLRTMPYIGHHQMPMDVHTTYTETEILGYLDLIHAQLYECHVREQASKHQLALLRTQLDDVFGVLDALDPPMPDPR